MKIPAEFAPQSWEMPPGAHIIEDSASIVAREFDGEKLDWLVALVEIPACRRPIFWMRPMDSRFDAGFVVFETTYHQMLPMEHKTEKFAIRASVSAVCKNNRLARHFFLNKNGELRNDGEAAHKGILVAPDGLAAWSLAAVSKQIYDASLFTWNTPLSNVSFLRLSACEVWKRVQILLAEPDSNAIFARRFALMSEEERRAVVFSKARGTDKEVEAWLCTLLMRGDVLNELTSSEMLHLQSFASDDLRIFSDDSYFGETASAGPEFEADVTFVLDWFFPINQEVVNYLCVKQWLKHNNLRFSVSVPYPTAHEQLEAQLRWREWLASINEGEKQI